MKHEPRGTKTRKERLNEDVEPYPFAAAALALNDDQNIHLIYRSLACFAGQDFFVIGSDKWFKGATNGLEKFLPIKQLGAATRLIDKLAPYDLIAVEQCEGSVSIDEIEKYPDNPLFIFGNESFGLTGEVLAQCQMIINIPHDGWHPCLNVGVSSGIIFHDYIKKNHG